MPETKQIFELIPKVMADIGAIAKTGRNEQQGYSFRGIDLFYNAAHPAMVKHGVFCCPQVVDYTSEDRVMKNGSPAVRVTMKVSHRFYASDGSYIEVITCGEGIDTSDKATNKAMSAAMKYALIELFCVPTADLEDSDRSSPEAGATGKGSIAEPVTLTRPAPVKTPELQEEDVRLSDEKFISTERRSYLARRFRESLKEELRPKAEALRHDALVALHQAKIFKSRFIDEAGNPGTEHVLESEFDEIGKALVKVARSLK